MSRTHFIRAGCEHGNKRAERKGYLQFVDWMRTHFPNDIDGVKRKATRATTEKKKKKKRDLDKKDKPMTTTAVAQSRVTAAALNSTSVTHMATTMRPSAMTPVLHAYAYRVLLHGAKRWYAPGFLELVSMFKTRSVVVETDIMRHMVHTKYGKRPTRKKYDKKAEYANAVSVWRSKRAASVLETRRTRHMLRTLRRDKWLARNSGKWYIRFMEYPTMVKNRVGKEVAQYRRDTSASRTSWYACPVEWCSQTRYGVHDLLSVMTPDKLIMCPVRGCGSELKLFTEASQHHAIRLSRIRNANIMSRKLCTYARELGEVIEECIEDDASKRGLVNTKKPRKRTQRRLPPTHETNKKKKTAKKEEESGVEMDKQRDLSHTIGSGTTRDNEEEEEEEEEIIIGLSDDDADADTGNKDLFDHASAVFVEP